MLIIVSVVALVVTIGGVGIVNTIFDRVESLNSERPRTNRPKAPVTPTVTSSPQPPTRTSAPPPKPKPTKKTTAPPKPKPTRTTSAPRTTAPPRRTEPPKKSVPAHLQPQKGYEDVPLPDYGSSLAEAARVARDNRVYGQKVSKSRCSDLPNLYNRPFPALSEKKMRSGLQDMADCIARMWRKPTARAGYQATKVKVRTYLGPVRSPCGNSNAPAFYCSANQQIYVARGLGHGRRGYGLQWSHYFDMMGHEYGHHLQARTGILLAASWHESSTSRSESLQIRRRIELQATCFSGMAMKQTGKVSRSYHREVISRYYGDEAHGSTEHVVAWAIQGYQKRDIYQCNTFRASAKDVR